jgi:curved DNA-binding protein CbpA
VSGLRAGRRSGQLALGVVPALLRDVYVGRMTGLLSFVRGWERRSVRFISGNIVHADTNAPGGHLGDLIVRHGLLQREELSRALAQARRTGRRLGAVLVEEGLLDKSLLDDSIELHVADTLMKVFGWPDGQWEFEEQQADAYSAFDVTLAVSTGDLILHAVRSLDDPDVVRYCLGELDRILTPSSDPLLRFQRIKLGPDDAFLLSRVDGAHSTRDVLATAPGSAEAAERALYGLLSVGLVEYAPAAREEEKAAAPEALRQEILEAYRGRAARTHFEVLGVAREAGAAEVRSAYARLARRLHPDIQHDPALADLKPQIESVFARLGEAVRVLGDPDRRIAYESTLLLSTLREHEPEPPAAAPAAPPADPEGEQRQADELLSAAEAMYAEGRYWDALKQCEDLLPLAHGKTRRRARVLLAECTLKNPLWRKQAEEELLGAIQEDPDSAEAFLLLGRIYKDEALPTRAAAMFRKVLELRPRHPSAAQELAALPGQASAEDAGLLKKLLGERRRPS